jgi:hypothetical protein
VTSATPDPLAAELAAIRERGYRKVAGAQCARLSDAAAGDMPRLVAAVEAAAGRHVRAVIDARPPFPYCKTCSGRPAWPCPEVAAISAALLGQDGATDAS